ncbi:hypothetical protein [Tautonia rosea]|uniref:hypothetical protein n=1 Tax=Tautonia rosea TaxID=2728037 RepID=UPI0014731DDF|nr:hypothetical protein [Tautonia rosea]
MDGAKLRRVLMLLATILVPLGFTAPVDAQSEIPFVVTGVGTIYDPLPPSPQDPFLEFDAIGTATGLGVYQTTRSTLEVLFDEAVPGEDAIPFENADDPPIILFQSDKGTQAFHYDATSPGLGVTLFQVGEDRYLAFFLAEFTPVPEASTKRFKRIRGGSFLMYAWTEEFSPGDTEVQYIWTGEGPLVVGGN